MSDQATEPAPADATSSETATDSKDEKKEEKKEEEPEPVKIEKDYACDCRDKQGTWYEGHIVEVEDGRIKVHFKGWADKYDEYINESDYESRLAPLATKSKKKRTAYFRRSYTPPANPTLRPRFHNAHGKTKNRWRASVSHMTRVQQEQLRVFRQLVARKQWRLVHRDHFDWYMFPIEDSSKDQYNVLADDVKELKADPTWWDGYLEGVATVAQAWGWDIKNSKPCDPMENGMGWTDWDVRLAKVIRSLWVFEHQEWVDSMVAFAWHVKPERGMWYGSISLDEVFKMGGKMKAGGPGDPDVIAAKKKAAERSGANADASTTDGDDANQ